MVFENAPTAFNGIVFTVIGRVVAQPNRNVIVLHEVNEPLHKLGAPTMVLWAIVEIDDQRRNVGKALTHSLPPLHEAIYQTVTGYFRGDTIHEELRQRGEKDAYGGHSRLRGKVVIGCGHRHTTLAATGKRPDLNRRLGIDGEAYHVRCAIGGLIELVHPGKDRI